MTSANVAYGFWSHDIEGPGADPEMYVRWMQWAAYSGVLRSHERGGSAGSCAGGIAGFRAPTCSNVRPWEVPEKCVLSRAVARPGHANVEQPPSRVYIQLNIIVSQYLFALLPLRASLRGPPRVCKRDSTLGARFAAALTVRQTSPSYLCPGTLTRSERR